MKTVESKITVQKLYTRTNDYPHFAPKNGKCYACGNQIYEKISYNEAKSTLITSCPYCNYSFCE